MEKSTQAQLLQMYANARATCSCGGHYKGQRNDALREKYALALREIGVNVPKDINEMCDKNFEVNAVIPEGKFNGVGSF